MKLIKFLIPFLAVVIPTSHKIINKQVTPEKDTTDESEINAAENNSIILQKADSEAQRFLLFVKHVSHKSHSSHRSHSSHKSHTSGNHYSHYSGSGDCSGCEFNVDDNEYIAPDANHNIIENLLK